MPYLLHSCEVGKIKHKILLKKRDNAGIIDDLDSFIGCSVTKQICYSIKTAKI